MEAWNKKEYTPQVPGIDMQIQKRRNEDRHENEKQMQFTMLTLKLGKEPSEKLGIKIRNILFGLESRLHK